MIWRILQGLADEICECDNGAEVCALYAAQQPDWVLMDIELPGQDGINATRQLKAAWPEANILIVTSYDEPALRQAAQEAGACGYVLKTNLLDLVQQIQSRVDVKDRNQLTR